VTHGLNAASERGETRRRRVLGVMLAIIVSCAATPLMAQKPPERPAAAHMPGGSEQIVPFAVGETLVYDVSWSSFVSAGEAVLSVKEKKPSAQSTAYHIVGDGKPNQIVSQLYTLYYKVEALLDAQKLLPQRASTYSEEGSRKRIRTMVFDHAARTVTHSVGEPATSRNEIRVPPLTQDALSALYVLRTLRLPSGEQLSIPVMNNGELYRAAFVTGVREMVACGLGSVEAMRIDIKVTDAGNKPVGRNVALWLTTGKRQLPVQIQADLPVGSFRLVLREARGLQPE
jgi:hypothetical protein